MIIRDWVLRAPGPWWLLSACKPFSPWCFIEGVLADMFPMTFGWCDLELGLWHETAASEWIQARHDAANRRYYRKKYPEDFE